MFLSFRGQSPKIDVPAICHIWRDRSFNTGGVLTLFVHVKPSVFDIPPPLVFETQESNTLKACI